MLLLIRKTIRRGIKITYAKDPDILGITLNKDFFVLDETLTIWFVYAPPTNTSYAKAREKVLSSLEKCLAMDDRYIVMGDLNGKTATAADFILDKSDDHSPINSIETYTSDTPLQRNNTDINPVDTQGKMILEICQTFKLRILW